jgi:hypothetical protein
VAPPPLRPARPRGLRFVRRGRTAVLTWAAVPRARVYRVRVRGSDGRLMTLFALPSRRSETLRNVLPGETFRATVTAVGGAALLPGGSASVTLKAVRASRPRRRKG